MVKIVDALLVLLYIVEIRTVEIIANYKPEIFTKKESR